MKLDDVIPDPQYRMCQSRSVAAPPIVAAPALAQEPAPRAHTVRMQQDQARVYHRDNEGCYRLPAPLPIRQIRRPSPTGRFFEVACCVAGARWLLLDRLARADPTDGYLPPA